MALWRLGHARPYSHAERDATRERHSARQRRRLAETTTPATWHTAGTAARQTRHTAHNTGENKCHNCRCAAAIRPSLRAVP